MEFWVGVTDNDWYNFLESNRPDEVNFWQPSGTPPFKRENIRLFLFKLHSPQNYIVGGGYFITYINLPISIAWETFREANGVSSYLELKNKITLYRESKGHTNIIDPEIGCSVLATPFFFPHNDWIPIPGDWAPNIVRGKMYNTEKETGSILWKQVQERIKRFEELAKFIDSPNQSTKAPPATAETPERYGAEFITRSRLGQGSFRAVVTKTYGKRCAITGERTLPVLEAAHIQNYAEQGPHSVNNGILLRADLHRLFDKHYITITNDYQVEVSSRIREEYENGKDYYAMHGRRLIVLPEKQEEYPARQFLEWHNNRFVP